MDWMRRLSIADPAIATTDTAFHAALTSTASIHPHVKHAAPILNSFLAPDPMLGTDRPRHLPLQPNRSDSEESALTVPPSTELNDGNGQDVPTKLVGLGKGSEHIESTARRKGAMRAASLPPLQTVQSKQQAEQLEHHPGWRDISSLASPNATSKAIKIPHSASSTGTRTETSQQSLEEGDVTTCQETDETSLLFEEDGAAAAAAYGWEALPGQRRFTEPIVNKSVWSVSPE